MPLAPTLPAATFPAKAPPAINGPPPPLGSASTP